MVPDFHQQLAAGAALYNAGRYHAAHDAWEESWRLARGPRRALLHGLILVAAGMLKVEADRPGGAATLFTRALGHLWPLRPACEGVALTSLVAALERAVHTLRAGGRPAAPPLLSVVFPEGLVPTPPPRPPRPLHVPLTVTHHTHCPFCGEPVELSVEGVGPPEEQYEEDCPVCCRPWSVRVRREESGVDVQVGRAGG